jgi:serine/threonine protein kinase/tetratricopeptide (TPR) repeat protein
MIEEDLFHRALEKPTLAEQLAYLNEACANQPELRERIERLLRSHRQDDSFLHAGVTTDQSPHEAPGTVIGFYKLIEQIGEGGMGTVWMAQQTEPVKRLVAVKLIKAGMDTAQVIARFEAERQALALMDHPNIARVLDGGTTDSGRPYFVMDLVKGVPITKYCDEHRLTPRQRLELFVPVCHAIQHAHQKGIIHRDLKPSNVLVAQYDGRPVPKVIDFGVAKAAGQSLTDKTLVTGFGAIVGTLEYMSPEQAEVNQLDIDTRSDIYSLGVLLYELLTGSTPFSKKELEKAGMLEMLRVIREQEPSKPSTKLSSSDALPTLSANRGTEPAKLTKLVRGELDWIVMKALEKDRNRRYETANGFAMDVQRYLADETVQACPPSVGYRLKKFARRNKGPVLAVSLVLLALVAGIVGTTWQAIRAANRAEGERLAKERAETNFTLANAAVEKYLGTVAYDPELSRIDLNRLRKKLLVSAVPFLQKLTEQKSDDPEVEAGRGRAYLRLAFLRLEMGENEAGIENSEAAQVIFARLADKFPDVPEYRQKLATSDDYLGQSLMRLGKDKEAEAAFRRAIGVQEKLADRFPNKPEYRLELSNSLSFLGSLLQSPGRLEEREAAHRRALDIREKLVADFMAVQEYGHALAQSHNNLGNLLQDQGKHEEAEAAYRRAIGIREKLADEFPNEPEYRRDLAKHLYNLGNTLRRLNKREVAEATYRRALAIWEKLAKEFPTVPEYRQGVARSHNSLAASLQEQGKGQAAEAAHRRALDVQEKLVADFPTVPDYRDELAQTLNSLGIVLSNWGEREKAEAAYRQALTAWEELARQFPEVAAYARDLGGGYCNLGQVIRDAGDPKGALGWYDKAVERLTPLLAGKQPPDGAQKYLRNSHWQRAQALDAIGRDADAVVDWERALALDDGSARNVLRSGLAFSRLRRAQKDKDAARCLAAAAEYEALAGTDAGWLYDAACARAVCAAVIPLDPKTRVADAAGLAKKQADLAMAWLHKAVALGFADAGHMKNDEDLVALRELADFKKLLAELENKRNDGQAERSDQPVK